MASGSRTRTEQTHLECPECKTVFPIYRKKSKQKNKGHVKHMYCHKCKEVTGHIEMKDDAFFPAWLREERATN